MSWIPMSCSWVNRCSTAAASSLCEKSHEPKINNVGMTGFIVSLPMDLSLEFQDTREEYPVLIGF